MKTILLLLLIMFSASCRNFIYPEVQISPAELENYVETLCEIHPSRNHLNLDSLNKAAGIKPFTSNSNLFCYQFIIP